MKARLAVLLCALLMAPAATAGPAGGVVVAKVALMEQDYRNEKGEKAKRLVPLTKLDVGDEVVFAVNFENRFPGPVDRVIVTDPIAPEVAYVDGSVTAPGAEVEFSADGGRSFAPASMLKVRGADGEQRPAGATDYTHIRWKLAASLAAGQKGVFRYRATLR